MIFFSGDTHSNFRRFNTESFPEQKEMAKVQINHMDG